MHALTLHCGISKFVARLCRELGRGGHSTHGGQDKSRELRPGRMGEERWHIKYFARGATTHDSLRLATRPWPIETNGTSRQRHDARR